MSLNRSDLVALVAEKSTVTKVQVEEVFNALQEILVDAVSRGESVRMTGLFAIDRVERAARLGRNPRTGEEIQIPAGWGVRISAGSTLKRAASAAAAEQ